MRVLRCEECLLFDDGDDQQCSRRVSRPMPPLGSMVGHHYSYPSIMLNINTSMCD